MRILTILLLGAFLAGCGAVEADDALERVQGELDDMRVLTADNTETLAEMVVSNELANEYNRKAWEAVWRWIDRKLEEEQAADE